MFSYSLKNTQGCLYVLSFVCFLRERRGLARKRLLKVVMNFQIIQRIMALKLYNIRLQQDTNWFCWIGVTKWWPLDVFYSAHTMFF